jgi:anti-sigma B factor antagonist
MQFQPSTTASSPWETNKWDPGKPEVMEIAIRFDATTAPVVEQTVSLLMHTGVRQVVIDAARTTFMTGAGLRSLLAAARDLQQAGGRFVVCNLTGQPKTIFEACGYDNMIAVFTARQDAFEALAS